MKGLPEERTIRLAQYMIEQKATVRELRHGSEYPSQPYIRISQRACKS